MNIKYNLLLDTKDDQNMLYYNKLTINHDGTAQLKVYYNGLLRQQPDLDSTRKLKDNKNLERSVRRTRSTIRGYAANNDFEYFITFTFARSEDGFYYNGDKKIDIMKPKNVHKLIKTFHRTIGEYTRRNGLPKMKFLFVLERHKSGHLHVHGLIRDIPPKYLKPSGRLDKSGKEILNVQGWKHGFSTAVKISKASDDANHKVASYITKYMTEDLETLFEKGDRRYYSSKGLGKPLEIYDVSREVLSDLVVEDIYENAFYSENKGYKVYNINFNKESISKLLTELTDMI